jgi:propanediol dehydratase small subunit
MKREVRAKTGRPLAELTIESLRAGALGTEDLRISREQLVAQAAAAEGAGHRQLAENLRRAAELTEMPNERLLEVYGMLRPGRATYEELSALAGELDAKRMSRVAAFVREAAEVYRARGITRRED